MTLSNLFLLFSLFAFMVLVGADVNMVYPSRVVSSTIHFNNQHPDFQMDLQSDREYSNRMTRRATRQYDTFNSDSDQDSNDQTSFASYGRAPNYDDFNSRKSEKNTIWNSRRSRQRGHKINFSDEEPLIRGRSKRMAIERRQYDDGDCQYHTLLNGDSEILLRKILPIRMRGRTILRHCMRPLPQPNDPRYRVLLKGNNKSSFGSMRVSVKI